MSAIRELPEHSRFEPFPIREPKSSDNVVTIKSEPKCGCGCKDTPNAYNYEGEMFASKDCVIRMMISEGWLKEVS